MKIVEIAPRRKLPIYAALVKRQAEIRKNGRGTFSRKGRVRAGPNEPYFQRGFFLARTRLGLERRPLSSVSFAIGSRARRRGDLEPQAVQGDSQSQPREHRIGQCQSPLAYAR